MAQRMSMSRGVALALALLSPAVVHAQAQSGQIQGVITNQSTGKPLSGVTVMVSGPALQADQAEITGPDGSYLITQLPPGDGYTVRLYFNDVVVERPGVRIVGGKTLTITLPMPMQKATQRAHVIRERAPTVDTANASTGVEIGQEILQNTATRGRTFESVLALAPGAVDPPRGVGGDVGVSISGSTGNENNFLVDGLNTTDLATGVLAAQVHQYFIKELNVITGGYQAEYGRATGGVISIVTKSGGNEFHGSVFGAFQPLNLTSRTVGRLGEALAARSRQGRNTWDVGFELGGPIIKDRLWFFAGFAPTTSTTETERVLRRRVLDPMTGAARPATDYECPGYLADTQFCDAGRTLALATEELRSQPIVQVERLYNWLGKLTLALTPDHSLALSYLGSPSTREGLQTYDGFSTALAYDPQALQVGESRQVHDVSLRYVGKFFSHKLQVDALYGFHYQGVRTLPRQTNQASTTYLAGADNPYSLSDFEDVPDCNRVATAQGEFNPCPLTSYRRGGVGLYRTQALQRHQLLLAASYFLNFFGTHALKLGFDFEGDLNDHYRTYTGDDRSGRRVFETGADGRSLRIFAQYARRGDDGEPVLLDDFQANTAARFYALYLRDSWNVGPVRGLVVNAGVRWEAQEIFGVDGSRQIGIYDNIAPRVGAVYDFTRKGRSKLYINYGRFYQAIPMTLGDRQFSAEGVYTGGFTDDCARQRLVPGGREVPVPVPGAGAPCSVVGGADQNLNGGAFGKVAPGLSGQYLNEVVAGVNFDVGWDVVLGAGYIYRSLGNIIEDISLDGGETYLIANPGQPADPARVAELEAEAARLRQQAEGGSAAAQRAADDAEARLTNYRAQSGSLPRARREYHALLLTAQKRLSNRVSVLANYTFSRTFGNYPGLYNSTTGDNNPNFSSAFDLVDLMANRNGPLPGDRPHNLKLVGTYSQPLPWKASVTAGLTFSLFSGRPIDVLGAHPFYGRGEVFILPRGAGGRTPLVTQFDLHVGYEQELGRGFRFSAFADVINLFNQQAVTNVDDDYTYSQVGPIVYGRVEDLTKLRARDGSQPVLNPNYGQPTAYQAPLYLRLGARLSF